jgi:DNA-binding response OmpR family regulator
MMPGVKQLGGRVLVALAQSDLRREIYRRLLEAEVFADSVGDGRQALEQLAENRYGILLLDMDLDRDLPGVDAFQLLDRVCNLDARRRPIVIVVASPEAIPSLDTDVITMIVRTPVKVGQLVEMIESCARALSNLEAGGGEHTDRAVEGVSLHQQVIGVERSQEKDTDAGGGERRGERGSNAGGLERDRPFDA